MSDIVERLKNAAESWKRTDCMIAREVLSEAALLDEAAARIEWLEGLFDFSNDVVLHFGPNDPVTKDAVVVLRSHYECRQDRPANAGPFGTGAGPTGASPTTSS